MHQAFLLSRTLEDFLFNEDSLYRIQVESRSCTRSEWANENVGVAGITSEPHLASSSALALDWFDYHGTQQHSLEVSCSTKCAAQSRM